MCVELQPERPACPPTCPPGAVLYHAQCPASFSCVWVAGDHSVTVGRKGLSHLSRPRVLMGLATVLPGAPDPYREGTHAMLLYLSFASGCEMGFIVTGYWLSGIPSLLGLRSGNTYLEALPCPPGALFLLGAH